MTPPTPTEVEELAREVRLQAWLSDPRQFATWILARFVRREEHERAREHLAFAVEVKNKEITRLRAELKGQRCDGSGYLQGRVMMGDPGPSEQKCPSCPACKPAATPKGDECPHEAWETARGGFGRKCADCGQWLSDDGGRTRESVSTAKTNESLDSYSRGFADGRDAAAAANVQQVSHVVELGSETLRALVAAQLMGGLFSLDDDEIEAYRHGAKTPDHEWAAAFAVSAANALLTHLREKETK